MAEKEKKHMSHIRNLVAAVEDRGYSISSVKWSGEGKQIEIIIDDPALTGNRMFLEKARDDAGAES